MIERNPLDVQQLQVQQHVEYPNHGPNLTFDMILLLVGFPISHPVCDDYLKYYLKVCSDSDLIKLVHMLESCLLMKRHPFAMQVDGST